MSDEYDVEAINDLVYMRHEIDLMRKEITQMREDQLKLLQGVQRFFEMAEQMKGNPLFSALMPPSAPPQRRK